MQGVRLEDVRRALQARDPDLAGLVIALTSASDTYPDKPIPEGALTYQAFTTELRSWRFMYKSDEEKRHYRVESFKELESNELLPDRLWLHEIVGLLWEMREDAYARAQLLEIIAKCPIKWGPWRAIKQVFKQAEALGDTEIFGAIAARIDALRASGYSYSEVTPATQTYIVRRAWRYLRRLGQNFPSRYPDAAVDFLRFYPQGTNWTRTWVANHVFFHETHSYGQASFSFWRIPDDLISNRAYAESWKRTPRPLFTLLERAGAEKVREFAIEALKADFRTVLREVEPTWVARLARVSSSSVHDFVVWLLGNVPKFEQASFRQMGLHDAVLLLLESPSHSARQYAADYARTHARDLPLEDLLRLANNDHDGVRKLATDLLRDLDPRAGVGLDAWGRLLGTEYAHKLAENMLRRHFGSSELTPAWFRERLLSDNYKVVTFAKNQLLKVHTAKSLGVSYLTDLFDEDGLESSAATWALAQMLEHFDLERVDQDFWRRALLHPLSSYTIRSWISEERLKPKAFGVDYWRALAFHPTWEKSAWFAALIASERGWASKLEFNEDLAGFSRDLLADVRQFSPTDLGFEWLMEMVERMESHYHNFAVHYMLKALVPADFAPADAEEAPAAAATSAAPDLGGATFVFTGKLATMTRKQAQTKVTDAGGKNAKSVTKTLGFLVVGDEGSPLFGQGKKGSKIVKAEKFQDEGHDVKVISETAFLQMLAGEVREVSADQTLAGCERLWQMAVEPGKADEPLRTFAITYIKHHHVDLAPALTERQVDPGAEIPRDFFSWERVSPLFEDERSSLRRLGADIGRWELARWAPPLHQIVDLCEREFTDVTKFFEQAFIVPDLKENRAYRLGRDKLDVDGVYRFCDSLDERTRKIGMALISLYADLAIPSELFRLTESPDRQMRAFVIRTIWSLYRDRGITLDWSPIELDVRFSTVKTKKGLQDYEAGPGPKPRPTSWPAEHDELEHFMRRVLYGIPPAKLPSSSTPQQQASPDSDESKPSRRARPVSARLAKRSMIEVMRDLAIEDVDFARRISPLLAEFMHSRGKSEKAACLVALTRIDQKHPKESLLPSEVVVC